MDPDVVELYAIEDTLDDQRRAEAERQRNSPEALYWARLDRELGLVVDVEEDEEEVEDAA